MEFSSVRPACSRIAWSAAAAILMSALMAVAQIQTAAVAQDDAKAYAGVLQTLRKELAIRFTSPEDPGLLARRDRLRKLFAGVPPSHAKTLLDRLGNTATADELSREFHYRLSTVTRKELLDILAKIPPPAAPPPVAADPEPPPALVWGTRPLPASESPRFHAALRHLETLVAKTTDARKWRYQCWIGKLKEPGVDDRVIEWGRVCPAKTGATGAAYVVGPCDLTWGTPVSQDDIFQNIKTIADVDANGADIGIITHLQSDLVVAVEMTALPLENLRTTHDMVVMAIDKFEKWADNQMGGSSGMPKAYVSIKDWIGRQQRNPKSVYSCQ